MIRASRLQCCESFPLLTYSDSFLDHQLRRFLAQYLNVCYSKSYKNLVDRSTLKNVAVVNGSQPLTTMISERVRSTAFVKFAVKNIITTLYSVSIICHTVLYLNHSVEQTALYGDFLEGDSPLFWTILTTHLEAELKLFEKMILVELQFHKVWHFLYL